MTKSKDVHSTLSGKRLAFSLAGIFTFFAVFLQTRELVNSASILKTGEMLFYGQVLFRDSTIHLGIINEILKNFPPNNFAYTAEGLTVLKNYHYFYDLLLAIFIKLTNLDINLVYFKIAPIIISVLFCIAIFQTTYRLSKNYLAAAFSIFFVIFANSLGPLIPNTNHGGNIFMSDQMLNLLLNPHGELSLVVFLALYIFLNAYELGSKKALLFFGLILSLSFFLKAYGGFVFAFGSTVAAIVFFLRKKDLFMPAITAVSLALMGTIFFFTIDGKVPSIVYAPFWTLDRMIHDMDRLNVPSYPARTLSYLALIPIYFLGNLGLRVIGLYAIWENVKNLRNISPSFVFLLAVAFLSFWMPIFFNQGIKAYDIVQFTTYFLVFMSIMFTISLFSLTDKIKNRNVQAGIITAVFLFFLVLSTSDIKSKAFLTGDKWVISKDIVSATNYVKENSPKDSIFLLPATDETLESHWFNYLADRRTVYSGWRFAEQVGVDKKKAVQKVDNVFAGSDKSVHFDYLFYQNKKESQVFDKIKEHYKLKPWYQNDQVTIFKRE